VIDFAGVSKAYRVYHGHGRGWLGSKLLPWMDVRRFADVNWALRDVDLGITAGEVVGVVGRNGSGKSTLLRLMAGITSPSRGHVRVNGELRCVLASGVAFDPALTGRENVIFGSIAMGVPRRVAKQRMDSILDFAEVADHADVPTRYYSRGMRARLALSVALQDAPEILLLDEALSAGDAGFADRCRDRLDELADSGRTVVVASHSMPFVRHTCSRALLLADGRIDVDGAPDDVVAAYHALLLGEDARDEPVVDDPRSSGDGAVSLVEAWMCGADGERRDLYRHGERVELRLRFSAPQPVANPRFRIELIASGSGTPVTETGSYYLDATTGDLARLHVAELDGEHELRIAWPENPLGCGAFEWRITVFSRDSADTPQVIHLREAGVSPFTSDAFPDRAWQRRTLLEAPTEVTLGGSRARDPAT
jgi:lipopolysaccharide transport system ATP-binding protein